MDTNGKPTVISTFCGTGGSSLGYKWAGYKELLAIDLDSHAVECFRLNFPEVPCWHKSIVDVTSKEIMTWCGLKVGELDVLDGSPPCQGFSTAGKREVRDPRNDLFKHYVRLIQELEPRVFVMENVSGMAKGKMKGKFIEIMQTLKNLDYNVKCKQMNSMYYGVPQSRERLIFIGIRKDLDKVPEYPIPSKKIITVYRALKNIKNRTFTRPLATVAGKIWDNIKPGQNGTYYRPGYYMNTVKINPNRPCPTIPKTIGGTGATLHWEEKRSLTIEEVKKLCSFPDDWKLTSSPTKQWARLGNAVMPKFMQAIAETIKKEIL